MRSARRGRGHPRQHLRARQLHATALLESDQYRSAAAEFERLLPTDDPAIRLGLATAYARLDRRGDAEALLTSVLGQENLPAVQLAIGQAYLAGRLESMRANARRLAMPDAAAAVARVATALP